VSWPYACRVDAVGVPIASRVAAVLATGSPARLLPSRFSGHAWRRRWSCVYQPCSSRWTRKRSTTIPSSLNARLSPRVTLRLEPVRGSWRQAASPVLGGIEQVEVGMLAGQDETAQLLAPNRRNTHVSIPPRRKQARTARLDKRQVVHCDRPPRPSAAAGRPRDDLRHARRRPSSRRRAHSAASIVRF